MLVFCEVSNILRLDKIICKRNLNNMVNYKPNTLAVSLAIIVAQGECAGL